MWDSQGQGVPLQALSPQTSRVPTAPHLLTPFPISRLKISKIQPLLCTSDLIRNRDMSLFLLLFLPLLQEQKAAGERNENLERIWGGLANPLSFPSDVYNLAPF